MPPVFGPVSPSREPLVVARDRQGDGASAVADRDDARLAAREPLLDDERGRRCAGDRRGRLVERVADRDALAGRQPVGLDDDAAAGRARPVA